MVLYMLSIERASFAPLKIHITRAHSILFKIKSRQLMMMMMAMLDDDATATTTVAIALSILNSVHAYCFNRVNILHSMSFCFSFTPSVHCCSVYRDYFNEYWKEMFNFWHKRKLLARWYQVHHLQRNEKFVHSCGVVTVE